MRHPEKAAERQAPAMVLALRVLHLGLEALEEEPLAKVAVHEQLCRVPLVQQTQSGDPLPRA
jgi:hypothetical protein